MALDPPPDPWQVQVVEAPTAGKVGLAGLAVPVEQKAPEKAVSVEEYAFAPTPQAPFTATVAVVQAVGFVGSQESDWQAVVVTCIQLPPEH